MRFFACWRPLNLVLLLTQHSGPLLRLVPHVTPTENSCPLIKLMPHLTQTENSCPRRRIESRWKDDPCRWESFGDIISWPSPTKRGHMSVAGGRIRGTDKIRELLSLCLTAMLQTDHNMCYLWMTQAWFKYQIIPHCIYVLFLLRYQYFKIYQIDFFFCVPPQEG